MKERQGPKRQILQPCELSSYRYQIDPYIGCEHLCTYCYALNQAETDWAEEILIYPDFAAQLERELSPLEPQPVYFGWNSDPYQPAEEVHQHTRQALEILANRGFSVCILTKSALVTRDIDVIACMPGSSVGFSIAFQEEEVRVLFEAQAPPNREKVAALKALHSAGIEPYVLICPVMPFITDVGACIDMVAPHADTIWFYALSMDSPADRNWQCLLKVLKNHYPELVDRFQGPAFSSDHGYWRELRAQLEAIQLKTSLNMKIKL
jgi:DNA repair photolyase